MSQSLSIVEVEAVINYWRARKPSRDGVTLAAELRALAEVYGQMVYFHETFVAVAGFPPKAKEALLEYQNALQPNTSSTKHVT